MRGGPDDTAGIGVPNHDDRPLGSVDGTIERFYVIGESGEGDRGGDDRDPGLTQTGDNSTPAGPVGPGSVDEYHRGRGRLRAHDGRP
jgi:hypothetical protein